MKLALLLILSGMILILAGCSTAEMAATATAVGGAAVALINQLSPVLPPEMLAKLQTTAASIDGTVEAVQLAVGTIADVIGQIRTATEQNFDAVAKGAADLTAQVVQLPTKTDLYMHDAGVASGSVGAARLLSIWKHGKAGKMA